MENALSGQRGGDRREGLLSANPYNLVISKLNFEFTRLYAKEEVFRN
jgi:hypothetical protein